MLKNQGCVQVRDGVLIFCMLRRHLRQLHLQPFGTGILRGEHGCTYEGGSKGSWVWPMEMFIISARSCALVSEDSIVVSVGLPLNSAA